MDTLKTAETKKKPEKKKSRGTLKIFEFSVYGDYASGVLVAVAYGLKTAQKMAFKNFEENKWEQSTYGIYKPEDLASYKIHQVKAGLIATHFYAE